MAVLVAGVLILACTATLSYGAMLVDQRCPLLPYPYSYSYSEAKGCTKCRDIWEYQRYDQSNRYGGASDAVPAPCEYLPNLGYGLG